MSKPQTTSESTEMTGRMFEQVEQSGKGFPSASRGMGGGLEGSLSSANVATLGRVRSILGGSLSSFLTFTFASSFLNALIREGAASGVTDAFSFPFPFALFTGVTDIEEADRVTRLGGVGTGVWCTERGRGRELIELDGPALWLLRACSSA